MKTNLQITPELGAALLCALLWFAFWLTAFEIQSVKKMSKATRSLATFLPAGGEHARDFLAPTLFALPNEQGFSGTFPESSVHMDLALDQPEPAGRQEFYLPYTPAPRAEPNQISLTENSPLPPRAELPAPGGEHIKSAPRPERFTLFLAPEIQPRTPAPMHLSLPGELPASVRVYLGIRPDGTVDRSLFDPPVKNQALAGAIRKLQFKPAPERTDSWLEIRFTPEGDS